MSKKIKIEKFYDTVIIGAGVVGFATAMYCGRLGLKTLVIGENIGGTITLTNVVENYPGFISISGQELAKKIEEHARNYGISILNAKAEKVEIHKKGKERHFKVYTKNKTFLTKTLIFATGTEVRKLNIPGEKEYENKGVSYCALCMPPNEEIVTNNDLKSISEITPLTMVLTAEGGYEQVAGFSSRDYEGKLISIRPRFFNEPVLLTPEHPILLIKLTKGSGANYWKNFKFSKPQWKPSSEITKEDCVLYPIIKEVSDIKSIKISEFLDVQNVSNGKIVSRKRTYTSKEINNEIPMSNDFLRLVGYYLSEGSSSRHNLRFYFRKDEVEYIEDVKKLLRRIFGLESKLLYKDNVTAVSVDSRIVADLFKVLFDKYAYRKSVPHFIMLLPPEKQAELIKGFWRGDGCVREKDFTFVTSSKKFAYQLRDILLRGGIIPSIQLRKMSSLNSKKHEIQGREISFRHDKYHISIGGQFLESMSNILGVRHSKIAKRKNIAKHAWIKNGFAVIPVREIKKIDYKGKVISLSVKNSHSYVSKGFIVHNCDGPLFKNKIIGVVGGSDSAVKEALLLTEYAKKVFIIYRGEKVHAEPVNMQRVEEKIKKRKLEIINNTNVIEIRGNQFLTHIIFDKSYKGKKEFKLDGLFVEIGRIPLSDLVKNIGVKTNEKGEIVINKNSETNIQGVYAAGDVTDTEFKQAITGVGEGVTAAYHAYEYVSKGEYVLPLGERGNI